jgi:hypothetical protein
MRNSRSITISDIKIKPILDSRSLNNNHLKNSESQTIFSLNYLISPNFNSDECDMITEGPICLFNGEKILLPNARHENLIGYWNFEEIRVLDNSGLRNHALNAVKSGPSFTGIGNSGYFTNSDYLEIPHTKAFEGSDFTITFWIFIIQDFFTASKGTRYCPLIQKGKDDLSSKKYSRFPAIYYDRKDKFLKIIVKTNNQEPERIEGESIITNSKINNQKWMHISLIKKDKIIKLYVNGILDNTLEIELRYYNSYEDESFIMAEAAPALGGIEPNFINLGCVDCSLQTASKSCKDGYRLCSPIELHTGAYQVARNLGWLNWNTHIWTYSALQSPKEFKKFKGLAICCLENK